MAKVTEKQITEWLETLYRLQIDISNCECKPGEPIEEAHYNIDCAIDRLREIRA